MDNGFCATLAHDLAEVEEAFVDRPLAVERFWEHEVTSQREPLTFLDLFRIIIILGGNRSGKTRFGRALIVAMTLGGDHPDVAAFLALNRVDPDTIPAGPEDCAIIALTSNDSLKYHRRQIRALLPKRWRFRFYNEKSKGVAWVEIRVPGYDKPATLWFLADHPGPDSVQGDRWRAVLHDEEGTTRAVWDEAAVRLTDLDGWQIMTNTPLNGLSWLYDEAGEPPPELSGRYDPPQDSALAPKVVYCMWSEHNPHLPRKGLARLKGGDASKTSTRLRGSFVAVSGRVYPQWRRKLHTYAPADSTGRPAHIPLEVWVDLPVFSGVDWGVRNPTAWVWARVDADGCMWVYREHYQAGWSTSAHAARIKSLQGPEELERGWCDPAAAQVIIDLRRDHDIYLSKANNDRQAGIDEVTNRLHEVQCPECGWRGLQEETHGGACHDCPCTALLVVGPGIMVSTECDRTVIELERLQRPDDESDRKDGTEATVKKDDHAADAVRYLAMGLRRYMGG